MKKIISIEGMSCGHCVKHVENALGEIEGIKAIDVSLEAKEAVVEMDGEVLDEDIKAAIEDWGYEVTGIKKV
ncbi:copper ion binding protein [Peptoclostridium litorale DSM 5388]|uniref:Copper chaperone CopZ n=1 Tax=Peptoclostridium litorale DSM 5388 TaxID=1121324 RepID=A0A069RDV0_PEPLI|nr:copper ion binding protein [Peptoclostridium litorale]KDR94380.1 hypothetical protein CLIT_20c00250 [Peptoclostridium litorale DSM 5388]SIO24842.1 copper ion binding protein [Peptoclostridium litorale DSM 5388]